MANITRHAKKRFKQRLGVHKGDANKNAKKALKYGIRHCDTEGSLNRYMTALFFRNRTANNIRIWNGSVYLFSGEKLITVFHVPKKYVDDVALIVNEREVAQNESVSCV